jgi:hypothetical protein
VRKIIRETDTLWESFTITVEVRRAILHHSKKMSGCPRPEKGSIAHFVREAVLDELLKCGVDFRKLNPKVYDKSMS